MESSTCTEVEVRLFFQCELSFWVGIGKLIDDNLGYIILFWVRSAIPNSSPSSVPLY
jgi:hypothetical protein